MRAICSPGSAPAASGRPTFDQKSDPEVFESEEVARQEHKVNRYYHGLYEL